MNFLFIFSLTCFLGLGFPVASASSFHSEVTEINLEVSNRMATILMSSKNRDDFIGQVGSTLDEESQTFLKNQISGRERTLLQVISQENEFLLGNHEMIVSFQYKLVDSGDIIVTFNRKKVNFDPTKSIEVLPADMNSNLPKTNSLHIWSTLLPEAQAVVSETQAVAAAACVWSMYANQHCAAYQVAEKFCSAGKSEAAEVFEIARFDRDSVRSPFSFPCKNEKNQNAKKNLRQCIAQQVLRDTSTFQMISKDTLRRSALQRADPSLHRAPDRLFHFYLFIGGWFVVHQSQVSSRHLGKITVSSSEAQWLPI